MCIDRHLHLHNFRPKCSQLFSGPNNGAKEGIIFSRNFEMLFQELCKLSGAVCWANKLLLAGRISCS